ncbi:MBO2, coiled coil flagellar protein [Ochromonadaceae sp. CCMP2298]|nr:MBO2, coiled coil flagellar protein [Ochromonadaceae sp. CCMP2298]
MEEETEAPAQADVNESIAFGLLNDVEKLGQVNVSEAEFLKSKYKKLFAAAQSAKSHEQHLSRRLKNIENEILEEKIAIEKARIDETEETRHLQNTGEVRSSLQIQLESTEQKDTIAKFELFELKKVHEELTTSLSTMRQQNTQLVGPVVEKLGKEIVDLDEQMAQADESYSHEEAQRSGLHARLMELQAQKHEKQEFLRQKRDNLEVSEKEPGRLSRQIGSIESAKADMMGEHRTLQRRLKAQDLEQEAQAKRRSDAEKLRSTIIEKLDINRATLEERESDVGSMSANLDKAKALGHDMITRMVELNVKKRDSDNAHRHLTDQLMLSNKDFDVLKRQLKKKRSVAETVKSNLPVVEENLKDYDMQLKNMQDDRSKKFKDLQRSKNEVDQHMARLLQQEGSEGDRKHDLERTIAEMDELEATVVQWLAEGKRQSKLLGVLSAQRDIKARECTRIDLNERESKAQVRMKELVILDLTKRCNEISNRLKEFSALYEVVKNERNKYVNLIQSSAQALAEMREKIRILHNEVEILNNERTAKDLALAKENALHQSAMNQRDGLRQDLNRLLSEYRAKQSMVEQQIQEIDKLNVVINNLEKDMLHLKGKYEHGVEDRNVTGVQLIDRNDELCILYERSNQQQEALRRGETESLRKEEELRLVRLQGEELKRRYTTAKRRLPELESCKAKIKLLEEDLEKERKFTTDLSDKLEDPKNLDRWRPLDGNDLDMEQLVAKIRVLEDRLDQKREALLEKELVLEEVSSLTEKLRMQAVSKRDSAKLLADQLNGLHGRIREVTKKMLASVSELSMYQASALRLQQEKMHREKALEEAVWRFDHGEAPSEDAVKELGRTDRRSTMMAELALQRREELTQEAPENMVKTAAEPRPTAYIPDDVGIPRPYGAAAPFKPTEAGATMRHIKPPQIKPIEI